MRRHEDGSFWLPKRCASIEAQMDKDFLRLGKDLRWMPKNIGFKFERFKDKYLGQKKTAFITGKGPSLDSLNKDMFKSWHVRFFINDSAKKGNELGLDGYSVQQDGWLQNNCALKNGLLFLSVNAQGWNPEAIIFDPVSQLKSTLYMPTVIATIKIAKYMGIEEFELYAFDAHKTNKIVEYANIIGYSSRQGGKDPKRFFNQKKLVEAELKGFKWKYV